MDTQGFINFRHFRFGMGALANVDRTTIRANHAARYTLLHRKGFSQTFPTVLDARFLERFANHLYTLIGQYRDE